MSNFGLMPVKYEGGCIRHETGHTAKCHVSIVVHEAWRTLNVKRRRKTPKWYTSLCEGVKCTCGAE